MSRVLVVDDEHGMREGCRRILEPEGHHVTTVADAEQALALAETETWDLALIDLRMPGMGGIELLPALRERDPDLVCVIITAYATVETAVAATKSGAYDYLPKPFTPDELLMVVRKALEHRNLVLEARRLEQEAGRSLLQLATERSRLRTIIDCLAEAVLVTNAAGQLALYNPAALRVLGLRALALGEKAETALGTFPALVELLGRAQDCSEDMLSQEINLPGGGVLRAVVSAIRDEAGACLGSVCLLSDISELRQVERAKAQFVAMVAHELKAPLAAIEGYLDILAGNIGRPDEAQRAEMLARCRQRTGDLLKLVGDLLDVFRMEQGLAARTVERVALAEVLAEVAQAQEPAAKLAGVTLTLEVPGGLPDVRADRQEMVRLFTNLVSNGIKYNRSGGSVTVAAGVEGQHVRVSVADTGLGIPAAALPGLGSEFYRVKTAHTRAIPGTGLGLAIVKRILEANHGQLQVTSEEEVGSTFTVYLPLREGGQRDRA